MGATNGFVPNADALVGHNARYAAGDHDGRLPPAPARKLAVVACMDARLDPLPVLGLDNGDAHVLRNAGGVITDDVIRSLCLSQRALGTREILLVHHTDCGLQKVDDSSFRTELGAELGVTPPWSLEAFADPHDDVRQSIRRLHLSPFIAHKDRIRGFVFDVADGLLREVHRDHDDASGPTPPGRGAPAG